MHIPQKLKEQILERALDLSKNVSEPAKNDFGNSPQDLTTFTSA